MATQVEVAELEGVREEVKEEFVVVVVGLVNVEAEVVKQEVNESNNLFNNL